MMAGEKEPIVQRAENQAQEKRVFRIQHRRRRDLQFGVVSYRWEFLGRMTTDHPTPGQRWKDACPGGKR